MASIPVTKQLGALLQEQQDPFMLEMYLIERGYHPKNKLSTESSKTSTMFMRKSRSCHMYKRRKFLSNCSEAVSALFRKLRLIKNPKSRDQKVDHNKETPEDSFLSTTSSPTRFNSCTESDTDDSCVSSQKGQNTDRDLFEEEDYSLCEQVDIDIIKTQQRILEDGIQLSPVSVLEETISSENSPIHHRRCWKKRQEEVTSDLIISDSCKLLKLSSLKKPSGIVGPDSSCQHEKIKLALQQTKQLLLDCVKEIIETHRQKDTWQRQQQQFREILGAEEIGKLLSENMKEWSKQSMQVANSSQLLDRDFLVSAEEWSYFKQQRTGIGMEIADAIFEDISSEIVVGMITILLKRTCLKASEDR